MCGTQGFEPGTQILTQIGWRHVETLEPGAQIYTYLHGLQPIRHVIREDIWLDPGHCPQSVLPLSVPKNALGNLDPFLLFPDNAALLLLPPGDGDVEHIALIQAADLNQFNGITSVQPLQTSRVHKIQFEREEIIGVANGALISCPPEFVRMERFISQPEPTVMPHDVWRLDHEQADAFLAAIELCASQYPTREHTPGASRQEA